MRNIEKDFEKFGLTLENLPHFTNPEDFAKRYKRCSLYEYENITYTQSTATIPQDKEIPTNA